MVIRYLRGLHSIVKLLLNSGANPNSVTGPPRKTPLHIAVAGGYLDIIKTLIKRGKAVWDRRDDWGWTVLHEACAAGYKEPILYLYKECRDLRNQADKLGRTPLLTGLLAGIKEDVIEVLVGQGEDPTKEDQVGRGCPEAAQLYCGSAALRIILISLLKRESLNEISKQLLLENAEDHSEKDTIKRIIHELTDKHDNR